MSDIKSKLLAQAKDAKGLKNHQETSAGGSSIVAAGSAPARLIGYVELGMQPQPDYQGQAKPPAKEIRVTFEVFGKENTREVDGKKVGNLLTIQLTEKQSEKAKFKKLFEKMRRDRTEITHMAQMIDEVFVLNVKHMTAKSSKRTYATIQDADGSYMIQGPVVNNFDTDGNAVQIDLTRATPPASFEPRLFLTERPSIEQWDSLFIDGTQKRKVKQKDGTEIEMEVSKNYLQEMIKKSLDFKGSAIETILLGLGVDTSVQDAADEIEPPLEDVDLDAVAQEPVAPPKEAKQTKKAAAKKELTKKAEAPVAAPAEQDIDALMKQAGLA